MGIVPTVSRASSAATGLMVKSDYMLFYTSSVMSGGFMGKSAVWFVMVVIVGALLGSFLGKLIGIVVPAGSIRNLFSTEIAAGLSPTTLDLRIIVLTIGCMFKFNVMSFVGIVGAAYIFRGLSK